MLHERPYGLHKCLGHLEDRGGRCTAVCQEMEPGSGVSVGASDSTHTAGIVMPAVGVYRRCYATGGVRRFVDGVAW